MVSHGLRNLWLPSVGERQDDCLLNENPVCLAVQLQAFLLISRDFGLSHQFVKGFVVPRSCDWSVHQSNTQEVVRIGVVGVQPARNAILSGELSLIV